MRAEDRLALARAVSRAAHARLLDPDNVAGPLLPLTEVAAGSSAYFVTPRAHLLVVDLDLPEVAAGERAGALDLLLDAAHRAGVPAAVLPSGRPGHRHAYLVTGTGGARLRLEQWCTGHGLDVRTHGVRPPGAPHRLGLAVALSDEQVQALLQVLQAPAAPEATAALAAELCPLVLPGRVRVAIRHGHARAGYASPSHARMALAVGVRARGGTIGLVRAVLLDVHSPLGDTFRRRDDAWQQAELARIWAKAGVWLAGAPQRDDEQVSRVAAAARAWPWKGAAGGSDLALLEELLRIARRVSDTQVGVALADLAVGAGVSVDTARAGVRRLVRAGWLHVVAPPSARTSTVYRLATPVQVEGASAGDVPERGTLGDLGADVARWSGLGKVTMRVARAIDAGLERVEDLAGALSMSAPAIRHHLRKLAQHRLATRVGDRWVLAAAASVWSQLAVQLGVAGARTHQQAVVAATRLARALHRQAWVRRMSKPSVSLFGAPALVYGS